MNYVIKCQKDGWYFKGFQGILGPPAFAKIQEARLYPCKRNALKDMLRMGQYGQRVVALTRMGNKEMQSSKEK